MVTNLNVMRSRQLQRRSPRAFRPVVLGLEDRMMLASGAAVSAGVAAVALPAAATINRVPGFLAGSTVAGVPPDLAAPFDLVNVPLRTIDSKTLDYWEVTLNKDDSFLLTVKPDDGLPDTGFAFRVWGPPNNNEIQTMKGPNLLIVAGDAGTYTIGISTSDNTTRTYTAQFQTYPGDNTNILDILQNYKNPADTSDNWPKFTGPQQAAYDILSRIAKEGAVSGVPALRSFNDFRQVNETLPGVMTGWLSATWDPFKDLLRGASSTDVYNDPLYPELSKAYTSAGWATIAKNFLSDPTTQAGYISVVNLLENADLDRTHISTFLTEFKEWSNNKKSDVVGDATGIADLLQTGLTESEKAMKKPAVDKLAWLRTLFNWIGKSIQAVCVGVGAAVGVLSGNPYGAVIGGLVGNLVGAGISSGIDAILQKLAPPPPPPPPDAPHANLSVAAGSLDSTMKNMFDQGFAALTSKPFLTSLYSNYGLLEAMGQIHLTVPAANEGAAALGALKQAYDKSVWADLLPRVYHWVNVPFNDNKPSSLPSFSFFVPTSEDAKWQNREPTKHNQYAYQLRNGTFSTPKDVVISDAKQEIVSLQNGKAFDTPPRDFTPDNNWGPGAISGPQRLTGHPDRFYAIADNSTLKFTLWRYQDSVGWWWTTGTLEGVTIQEWRLVSKNGTEIPSDVAQALFGPIPEGGLVLVPTGANPKPYARGYYVNFEVPKGGLATRFEVFADWSPGNENYSPRTFQPSKGEKGWMYATAARYFGYNSWFNYNRTSYADYQLAYGR